MQRLRGFEVVIGCCWYLPLALWHQIRVILQSRIYISITNVGGKNDVNGLFYILVIGWWLFHRNIIVVELAALDAVLDGNSEDDSFGVYFEIGYLQRIRTLFVQALDPNVKYARPLLIITLRIAW